MAKIQIEDINIFESFGASIYNRNNFVKINYVSSIGDASKDSLVFLTGNIKKSTDLLHKTKASVVICNEETARNNIHLKKCYIVSDNPKLFFTLLINHLKSEKKSKKGLIHSSVFIHPLAKIHHSVTIGPNSSIGECVIEEGTIICSNCSIYDNVKIGKNVIIDSGAVIGAAGFGFVRDQSGVPHQFPQLGKVIIEDNVEIGANTCVDRGALDDTIIHKGVKIDNLVQIAHNVEIGRYTYIMGLTAIAGSVVIGERCWIAPSKIKNKVTIGNDVTVGFGAVVLNSIPDNTVVMGDPAITLDKYSKLQYKLKKYYKNGNK